MTSLKYILLFLGITLTFSYSSFANDCLEQGITSKRNAVNPVCDTIPENAIAGDFDGDGVIEHLWVTAEMDDYDYAITPFQLCSDNPKMGTLSWDATRDVILANVGQLNEDMCDYIIAIPCWDSNWVYYNLLKFKDGKWQPAIKAVSIWIGDEDWDNYVKRASKRGYVEIKYNDHKGDPETGDLWTNKTKTVKLKF